MIQPSDPKPTTGPMLVVGLGNPGPTYEKTRHNAGFFVIEELARRIGSQLKSHKAGAEVLQARLGQHPIVLAKPGSFMNVSGKPVSALVRFYSVAPLNVVVVHDELDLESGVVRLKRGGGEGGHNGLRSISLALGTKDYIRVRLGIGRPPGRQDPADYVLKPFGSKERADIDIAVQHAADSVEMLLTHGLEATQNRFHAL